VQGRGDLAAAVEVIKVVIKEVVKIEPEEGSSSRSSSSSSGFAEANTSVP